MVWGEEGVADLHTQPCCAKLHPALQRKGLLSSRQARARWQGMQASQPCHCGPRPACTHSPQQTHVGQPRAMMQQNRHIYIILSYRSTMQPSASDPAPPTVATAVDLLDARSKGGGEGCQGPRTGLLARCQCCRNPRGGQSSPKTHPCYTYVELFLVMLELSNQRLMFGKRLLRILKSGCMPLTHYKTK